MSSSSPNVTGLHQGCCHGDQLLRLDHLLLPEQEVGAGPTIGLVPPPTAALCQQLAVRVSLPSVTSQRAGVLSHTHKDVGSVAFTPPDTEQNVTSSLLPIKIHENLSWFHEDEPPLPRLLQFLCSVIC